VTDTKALPRHRPRVEGDRQDEILQATVVVLAELGYDRLTMDAVAAAAKASKATLYRRWSGKAELVVDAVSRGCPVPADVDTGTLRGDLVEMSCGAGGLTDDVPMSVVAGLLTALHRDAELQRAFQERFIAPRLGLVDKVYRRAADRGEIPAVADVEVLAQALPAIVVHRSFVLGIPADQAYIERIIDHLILPAAHACGGS
jgi:AcrR family transcriptional regulator